MWDLQLSNWMIGLAGSGATLVAIIILAMFAYLVSQRLIAIRDNENSENKRQENRKHYFALVGIFFVFVNMMMVMFTFQSNAPKYRLEIREALPVQEVESANKPLPAVSDLSPEKLTAEETAKRLEELRKKQQQSTSIDEK